MSSKGRMSTGIAGLDDALGGGLLPGSLTMIVGATGIGKTQLGLQFSLAGTQAEGSRGAIIDLSSRGDSQNHSGYAERLMGDSLTTADPHNGMPQVQPPDSDGGSDADAAILRPANPLDAGRPADVLPFLGYRGQRVLRSQMDTDQWHAWQSELNRRLPVLYHFVYGHLLHGTRRFVIDGIEPQQASADSLQLDLTEMIYHRMLRQEHDWLAREVLRERFRQYADRVTDRAYDHTQSSAVLLLTTKQSLLDKLIIEPLADGDLSAGANTLIVLGRVAQQTRMERGLFIVKHRGSYADQRILPFTIGDGGIQLDLN